MDFLPGWIFLARGGAFKAHRVAISNNFARYTLNIPELVISLGIL
jgi:hypothetical protein